MSINIHTNTHVSGECDCVCLFTCGQNCKFVNCEWGYVPTFYPSPTTISICSILLSCIARNCMYVFVCMNISFFYYYFVLISLLLYSGVIVVTFIWDFSTWLGVHNCGWSSINPNVSIYVCMYVRAFIILYTYGSGNRCHDWRISILYLIVWTIFVASKPCCWPCLLLPYTLYMLRYIRKFGCCATETYTYIYISTYVWYNSGQCSDKLNLHLLFAYIILYYIYVHTFLYT